jgi:hypothetical protein
LPESEARSHCNEESALEKEVLYVQAGEEIVLDEKVTEVSVEILEHLPEGQWHKAKAGPPISIESQAEGEVTMNEFLPLMIEHYEGSVFSGKHYSCSLL